MSTKKMLVLFGLLIATAVLVAACAGPQGEPGPAGPPGPQGPQDEPGPALTVQDITCTECHNDTALITSKKASWETSLHGSGTAFLEEGGRNDCAFCHSGAAFSAAVAAGQNFSQVEAGDANPTHQDCRTCHQIHTTYTSADWALETDAPVTMVTSGVTFDGGSGNLCANCHQARRYMANFAAKDASGNPIADKYTPTIRFNTHYSVQADVLLGAGDFGVEGKPGSHYSMVENTCVGCHMGESAAHGFEPQLAKCQECHADVEDFNVNGYLTEFEENYKALEAALLAKGLIAANPDGTYSTVTKNADGTPVVLDPGPAQALFFYNLVHEDGSEGIHNPNYFKALMENALAALAE
ncbi:MAG: hypothetical protein HXY35_08265 [Chloroflexi bacterium]|nr:hypothetical protein [Chloroflexota bacterium]